MTKPEYLLASLCAVNYRHLQVLHRGSPTERLPESVRAAAAAGEILLMHTCQRLALVSLGDVAHWQQTFEASERPELHAGAEAYGLLLRLACGLESRLLAETEVFGQFKSAWSTLEATGSPLSHQLSGCVQALFRDAKEIRSHYLTGIGSASYGSLVRKLLGARAGKGAVLMVGAGQIASAVAPWLKSGELWLWNRNAERARELAVELQRREPERVIRVLDGSAEAELAAWQQVEHVVVCIPADEQRDAARVSAWQSRADRAGRLIHLGVNRSELPGAWRQVADLTELGALYDLLQSQNEQRRAQVQRALQACQQKSLPATGRDHSDPLTALHS